MRTEQVTKVWEFYRDNCAGYKEPMRKQLRELDSYVDHLESLADDGEKAAEENEKLRLEVEQLEEERDEHFRRYDELEAENTELREFISQLIAYIDPTEHQDTCNRECPAYGKCVGSTFCEFPYWALKRARELGMEVD